MGLSVSQRVGVFAHVGVQNVVIGKHISASTTHGRGMAGFADDVVLNQVLGSSELRVDHVGLAAVVAIAVIQIVVTDLAGVHVRQVNICPVYGHVTFHIVNPAVSAGL